MADPKRRESRHPRPFSLQSGSFWGAEMGATMAMMDPLGGAPLERCGRPRGGRTRGDGHAPVVAVLLASRPARATGRASCGDGCRAVPAKPCPLAHPSTLPRRTDHREERRAEGRGGQERSQRHYPCRQEFPTEADLQSDQRYAQVHKPGLCADATFRHPLRGGRARGLLLEGCLVEPVAEVGSAHRERPSRFRQERHVHLSP
jgi:hypothetical protein